MKIDSKPLCLTDTEPYSAWMSRKLVGNACNLAADIADGREIFAMFAYPGIVKWNNGALKVNKSW